MKRARRHKSNPEHREKVLAREFCDMCGEKFTADDKPEGHHTFGRNWRKNCKSWETIKIDYRMILVHGPATDGNSCHGKAHAGLNTDEATFATLIELYGDCALSDKLTAAGYVTPK